MGKAVRMWPACVRVQPHPPVLIVVSSIAAAGPTQRGQIKTEHALPNPISNYGRSKRAGELAAARYADRVPITVVRPGIVFGAGGMEMLPMFRSIYRLRIHAVAGLHSPPLSVIHVSDLVELLDRAADHGQRIATGAATTPADAATILRAVTSIPTISNSDACSTRRWAIATRHLSTSPTRFPGCLEVSASAGPVRGRPHSLNIDKIREAVAESWACSCEAAQRDLDFAPRHTLLEQLRQTAAWYRDQGWL